jgi:ABC-2 family transporter
MTAQTTPAPPERDAGLRPVPWRRMAWVTWRQHRAALAGVAALLGALAVYLWLTGLQIHHAYAADCHPASSLACTINFTGRYATTVNVVRVLLLAVPTLIGALAGAPVLAREMETGTFRYAWTQGIGRWRWALAKLVLLAVAVAAAAGAFTVLFSWYARPFFTAGYAIPFATDLFDALGVAFAAWTLAAFAIGALAGMLIRRVVPAIAATLAVYAGLALATALWLREHYMTPLLTSKLEPARYRVAREPVVRQGRQLRAPRPGLPASGRRLAALPFCQCLLPRAVPHPARLHAVEQLSARQPVLAVPVDRGRLAARIVDAAHRRHRLAGPPPRGLTRPGTAACYIQRAAHLQRMRELTELKRRGDPLDVLLADHIICRLEADLRWIDRTAARLDLLARALRR